MAASSFAVTTGGYIYVQTPYGMGIAHKAANGYWQPEERFWRYPATPETARMLRLMCHDLHADDGFRALETAWENNYSQEVVEAGRRLPEIPGLRGESWAHQKAAYAFIQDKRAAMLYMGMGTGKSRVVVGKVVNERPRSTLIVGPRSVVKHVWAEQFEKHAGAGNHPVLLQLERGTVRQKTERLAPLVRDAHAGGPPLVAVIGYDSAMNEPFASWSLRRGFDLLVVDESHKAKAPSGVRSRFLGRLALRCRQRLALTGTPMAHSPLDVFAQYRILDPNIYGNSFTAFQARYAIRGGFHSREIVGYINLEELNSRFYSIAFHVGGEVLDLPPAIQIDRYCTLSDKAWGIYADLEEELMAQVEAGTVTAANALVKLLRHQQLTGGYLKRDDGEIVQVDSAKADLLEEVLEEIDPAEPVVVFCRFSTDIRSVHERAAALGRTSAELSGQRDQLADWKDGKATVLAVQIQSGGAGLDFTRAAYCIYYSVGFSLGDFDQSVKRVHRPGQTRTTYFIHLLAEGTVDERVYEALNNRRAVVEAALMQRREPAVVVP